MKVTDVHPQSALKFYNFKEEGITQSLMADWTSCRVKGCLRVNCYKQPGRSSALVFGSMTHSILEDIYTLKASNPRVSASSIIGQVRNVCKKHANKIIKGMTDSKSIQEVEYFKDILTIMIPLYINKHKKDFNNSVKWVAAESQFDVEFEGYRLRGKRDGLFKVMKDKSIWLLETKTKGQINVSNLLNQLNFSFQNLFYILATQIEMGLPDIKGVRFNIIRRPSIKQKQSESYRQFLQRLSDTVQEKHNDYFIRFDIAYTREMQKNFKKELHAKLVEFERWFYGHMPTYKNESNCSGLWNCQYLEACGGNNLAGYVQEGHPMEELME